MSRAPGSLVLAAAGKGKLAGGGAGKYHGGGGAVSGARGCQQGEIIANFYSTHYRSGEEIRAGDCISWAGSPGRVVFVAGSGDLPAPWSSSETFGKKDAEGFMLDVEGCGLVFLDKSDEDLEFLARGQAGQPAGKVTNKPREGRTEEREGWPFYSPGPFQEPDTRAGPSQQEQPPH